MKRREVGKIMFAAGFLFAGMGIGCEVLFDSFRYLRLFLGAAACHWGVGTVLLWARFSD